MRRKRFPARSTKKVGAPPGTLMHVGERKQEQTHLHLYRYDQQRLDERPVESSEIERILSGRAPGEVTWLNIDGVHDPMLIQEIGKSLNVHPLVLEDILHTEQRPKLEDYDDYLFIVLKMLFFDAALGEVRAEQVSILLGADFVVSFQELEGDVFETIRDRLRGNKGRIRQMGADYLAYALLDSVIDNYFVLLERIGNELELLEDELIERPSPALMHRIHAYKREMILLRKAVWPLREVIGKLQRQPPPLVAESTGPFLRDIYDHTIQVIDTIETFRDLLAGLLDIYLSSMSNRLNEVMKLLTIIATIFIPLTFLAGVYGMNFEHMPELHWRWGYPAVWLLMIAVALGMLWFFRKKRWI
jgi:magnesium transporter